MTFELRSNLFIVFEPSLNEFSNQKIVPINENRKLRNVRKCIYIDEREKTTFDTTVKQVIFFFSPFHHRFGLQHHETTN